MRKTVNLYDKIIDLIPSDDLKACLKDKRFVYGEKDLLKFINDYSSSFEQKLDLLNEAAVSFSDRTAKRQAAKLIEYHKSMFDAFMTPSEDTVYEIIINDDGDRPDDEHYLTKTFGDAVSFIKSYLKCYKDVGARDNENSRYEIYKKTMRLPKKPSDIYNNKVGTVGECFLGHKFRILDVDMYDFGNEYGCRKSDCDECGNNCIMMHEPKVPAFLDLYDLVAFISDPNRNATKPTYGVTVTEMNDGDYLSGSCVILLSDNEYVKMRNGVAKDENGYYKIFDAHCHPDYTELFKPRREDVPDEVYADYLYAVESLKKIDRYSRIRDIVREELNKIDPMGLRPGKVCPIDEYDPEAEIIAADIENIDAYELAKRIADTFDRMFGEKFSNETFLDCARSVLEKTRGSAADT